ncbi:MAG: fructose-6-phosphate aldolase [Proteobacteria bacterium]|nr:fructose-6-phosphate aldolase [Pseudomonadota bacterium]
MKIFLDTADVKEVRDLVQTGLIDGITTNPTLLSTSEQKFTVIIEELCELVKGPVSVEVTATVSEKMIKEGKYLAKIAPNVTIKVPLTMDGLKACRSLVDDDIMVNVTLCFSPAQALLAAKAGATFVSPFIGRLDDVSHDGIRLIEEIIQIYNNYPSLTTEVLAASIRHPLHVVQAAQVGADIVTVPPKVLRQLFKHPLTDQGIKTFLEDWQKTGQSIL